LHNALEFGTHFGAHVEKVNRVVTFLVGVSRMIVLSALLIPVGKVPVGAMPLVLKTGTAKSRLSTVVHKIWVILDAV
jgi:hypothetical protein